ncbi:MAG: DUF368 domain-containing protein [Bacillota bacterium]|nr:DUF368 domain-containing protein [Bacillota bacterium]
MRFLKTVFLGLVIGIAAITPGLSGGALAASIGLYEPIIRAINCLAKEFKKNSLFLLPLVIGGAIGVLAFSNVMAQLMQQAPSQVKLLSLGLVAGSLPTLIRQANVKGFRKRYLLVTLAALVVVYQLGALPQLGPRITSGRHSGLQYIYFGLIYAVGTIVPGISSSFIFMHLGIYDDLLRAVATIDMSALLPAAVGFGAGMLLLIRLVEALFRRYYSLAYYAVIGFLLGSALLIVPTMQVGWRLLLHILVFLLGAMLSLLLLKLSANSY